MSTVLTEDQILALLRTRFPGEEQRILAEIGTQALLLRLQLATGGGAMIGVTPPAGYTATTLDPLLAQIAAGAAGVTDGDKGDITVSGSGASWTIDLGVVGNTKLANVATSTIKGRVSAGTGAVEDLTPAQVRGIINVADGATANASDAALRDRSTHTGTQTLDTTTDTATRVAMTPAERTKLASVATGATANATDAALRDRSTHTGTQLASTISDFNTAADARVALAQPPGFVLQSLGVL